MTNALGESSKGYPPCDRSIETERAYFCGAHQPVGCGNQGMPVEHNGVVRFKLYPCNAQKEGYQKPLRAAQPATEGGGLELKLAERSV